MVEQKEIIRAYTPLQASFSVQLDRLAKDYLYEKTLWEDRETPYVVLPYRTTEGEVKFFYITPRVIFATLQCMKSRYEDLVGQGMKKEADQILAREGYVKRMGKNT